MRKSVPEAKLVDVFHHAIVALVRGSSPDLTARQLSVLLTCYLANEAPTISTLARQLRVPRSSISRAVERLVNLRLAQREVDPADHRNTLILRTPHGQMFMDRFYSLTTQASAQRGAARVNRWSGQDARAQASQGM